MPSTYSPLKIELPATGEQSGTWGNTTNTNLGTALEEAITGSADVAFSSDDVTLTLTDTNAAQTARNLRLNLTGTSGGARQLILGSGCQIEKLYLINNGLADTVTVKNTTGTGIAVPAGRSVFVFNNGTNVLDAVNYLSALNLGAALPVLSGGTGQTTYTDGQLLIGNSTGNTLTKATLTAGTGISVTNSAGAITIAATNSGVVTSVTGTSPVVSSGGATPAISLASAYGDTLNPYASKTANNFLAAPNGSAGVPTFRAVVAADIPTLNQNTTGTASNVTGTVAFANGGTGETTRQAAMDALAGAVTSGSYLRGNGTDVVMATIQVADVPTLNQNTTGSAATLTTGRTIAITGDLAYTSPSFNGSTNVTAAGTLATVNANVGSFTNANVTVNAK
jgi:hypothetical protein